ncbi:MAG: hypothetical protein WCS60_11125, partial [Hydrogenophaga sp.]
MRLEHGTQASALADEARCGGLGFLARSHPCSPETHLQRRENDLFDPCRAHVQREQAAVIVVAREGIEQQITRIVNDGPALVDLHALHHMRGCAEHGVGPCVHQGMCQRNGIGFGFSDEIAAGMHGHQHDIGKLARVGQTRCHHVGPTGRIVWRQVGLPRRGGAGRSEALRRIHRENGHPIGPGAAEDRCEGLFRVRPRTSRADACRRQPALLVHQGLRPVVTAVVVGG